MKQGQIVKIIYHKMETGYTVAIFETEDEQFKIVGRINRPTEGKFYQIDGYFEMEQNYGEQFKIESVQEIVPRKKKDIQAFLASGIIKGVGEKTAELIVAKFGEKSLEVIEKEPHRLIAIRGISEKKLKDIVNSYNEHKYLRDVAIFLQKHNIHPHLASVFFELYGENTIEAIQENPYRLINEVRSIGFKKADAIARKVGFEKEDEKRIQSAIIHQLWKESNNGNTYLSMSEILAKTSELIGVPTEKIEDEIIQLAFAGKIHREKLDGSDAVFLPIYYEAENYVAMSIRLLTEAKLSKLSYNIDDLIRQTEERISIKFSEEQKKAITNAFSNSVTVITGGPGTGKTTILNGIISIAQETNLKFEIAAPTGRAAKKISEATGYSAVTIHRLLGYYYSEEDRRMHFGKNEHNKIETDVIIIDESSMIDISLMQHLMEAVEFGTRIILLGDINQLPSVGAGNVLKDIIDSEYVYVEKLTQIFRQAQESMIVTNAHNINRGEPIEITGSKDFVFDEVRPVDGIKNILGIYIQQKLNLLEIQVITPMKRGTFGTISLNNELQKIINPPSKDKNEKVYGDKIFREGDKVMQIKNNYMIDVIKKAGLIEEKGVFNGEIGFIKSINDDEKSVTVVFDDEKYVTYGFANLEELELAYAITVHKSQGSEFDKVIIPTMRGIPYVLATRNLIYTAVTRAKKEVVIIGDKMQLQAMIDNVTVDDRNSGLGIRLRRFIEIEN